MTGVDTIDTAHGAETTGGGPVRRPRDRKITIAERAGDLFAERGFGSVRMDEIAAAAGITARAVYRHYTNKQSLLSHIVNTSQRRYLDALDDAGDRLDTMLPRLAAASLDSTHFAVLWQREARHLTADDHRALRGRLNDMATRIAGAITERRPDLTPEQTEIRAWVVLALLSSPGHHDTTVPRPTYDRLLVAACNTAVDSGSPEPSNPPASAVGAQPISRREQLLAAAARAFRRSGYQAVGIDEIGEAAGIAGPAIYRYFDAKSDILVALLTRYHERITHESSRALRASDPGHPAEVLKLLVRAYTTVAAEDPDLVAVAVTESLDLPAADAERFSRIRGDIYTEWGHWLTRARPDLPRPEAALLARIAAILVDDTVRVGHLLAVNGLPAELYHLASAVLLDTDLSEPRPNSDAG